MLIRGLTRVEYIIQQELLVEARGNTAKQKECFKQDESETKYYARQQLTATIHIVLLLARELMHKVNPRYAEDASPKQLTYLKLSIYYRCQSTRQMVHYLYGLKKISG